MSNEKRTIQEFLDAASSFAFDDSGRLDLTNAGVRGRIAASEMAAGGDPERLEFSLREYSVAVPFAVLWQSAGRNVFSLSHSIAAMLAVTKSPPVDWKHLPYYAFVIDAPIEFFPDIGCTDRRLWIGVALATDDQDPLLTTGIFGTFAANWMGVWDMDWKKDSHEVNIPSDTTSGRFHLLSTRMASNVIAYVSQHRECVRPRNSPKHQQRVAIQDVSCPADVHVDRLFRDRAKELINARNFDGARRALAHIVRGHWRNQAVGAKHAERRLMWIRPFRRGDEAIGNVVSRVSRINEDV